MIDLNFAVTGARPLRNAAAPTLLFGLNIRTPEPVQAILLRCQLQIEPRRRTHSGAEQERLADVFGEPERWGESLRPLVWSQATIHVPAFEAALDVDVPVACTYDFDVTAAQYLAALGEGEIPLRFLFSGSAFVEGESGFAVRQIPWSKEAVHRMPVTAWRDVMDSYFPGSAWIRVRRETLDLLQRQRARHGWTNWDETIAALVGEEV
ncbi:MAG: DUF6084 family protein [Acidobacteriia bacterium]|nr:DUF6084 family protein [Terriglobia bacterium]